MERFGMKDDFKTYCCSAMITGLIMALVSSPIDVVKTRMMS